MRGMKLKEDVVAEGDALARHLLRRMLASGDDALVKIVKVSPEEDWARLRSILVEVGTDRPGGLVN